MIIKPHDKALNAYYAELKRFQHLGATYEQAIREAFANVLVKQVVTVSVETVKRVREFAQPAGFAVGNE